MFVASHRYLILKVSDIYRPLICILIPKGRKFSEPFSLSLISLILNSQNSDRYTLSLIIKDNEYIESKHKDKKVERIAIARQNLVDEAIKQGADYVFFLDDDMIIPSNCIDRMLDHNLDFVSGIAFKKMYPFEPSILNSRYYRDGDVIRQSYYTIYDYPKGLIEVEAVGLFCSLIKTNVFSVIRRPFFELPEIDDDSNVGEDVAFCRRLWEAGIKVMVDTTITCGHLNGDIIITEDNYIHARNT